MDRIFGLDHPANDSSVSHLCTFHDPITLSIAQEILTEAQIPFLKKERGSGAAVRLITGFQSFGTDLFVRPEDAERASELLTPLLNEASDAESAQEEQ